MDARPKLLIVEDNFLAAEALSDAVKACGYDVAGTVGHVQTAFRFLRNRDVDGAIVDIDLHGEMSFPVCEELQRLNVPFFFLTVHQSSVVPQPFCKHRLLNKPVATDALKAALAEFTPVARRNRLLECLPQGSGLLPLEHTTLEAGQVLHVPGQPIHHVYFVESGLISIVGADRARRGLEVGMIGFEGMTGCEILLGDEIAAHQALVLFAASAQRVTVDALREAMARSRSLTDLLLRFAHAFMVQTTHTAIAAGRASLVERLARTLLMWQDRLGEADRRVTHNALAMLMGVYRPSITLAVQELEGKRLIRAARNRIRIRDRAGLEQAANGFYGKPEEEYGRLLPDAGGAVGLAPAASSQAG